MNYQLQIVVLLILDIIADENGKKYFITPSLHLKKKKKKRSKIRCINDLQYNSHIKIV